MLGRSPGILARDRAIVLRYAAHVSVVLPRPGSAGWIDGHAVHRMVSPWGPWFRASAGAALHEGGLVTGGPEFGAFDRELADFSDRVTALRTVRESSPDIVDALLVELELAEEELRVCREELTQQSQEISARSEVTDRERGLLRVVFGELPVPVFLLDHSGSVRRANRAAAELLGTSSAYVAGKPFPVFVDLTARAAFRSRLSAVLRSGGTTSFTSVITAPRRRLRARIMLSRLNPPSEARPLVAAAVLPPGSGEVARGAAQAPAPARTATDEQARGPAGEQDRSRGGPAAGDGQRNDTPVFAAERRADLLSQVTRLLLGEESLSEPVTLHRVAWLLQEQMADWVIIDLARGDGVTRAAVAGPERGPTTALIAGEPASGAPLHAEVLETGKAALHPVIPDENALGITADGRPVLMVLGAGSLLSVPLHTGGVTTGVLTLVRRPEEPVFGLPDLRVLEEIGEHLALALRAERRHRRRSETAAALQASLLPQVSAQMPGLDWAAAYRAGTEGAEVGGDFYDVFRSPGGWGVVLGDVCGKGEEAAAVTAMVRHGIRLLSLWEDHPAAVFDKVNAAMIAQQETSRFVTAAAAHLSWKEDCLAVELTSAGHPGAVVLRAGGAVSLTPGGGLPLGLFDDGATRTDHLSLAPGDMLLLYSDGVTEMRAAGGALYGTARLAEVLTRNLTSPAASVVKAVEDDVSAFGHGAAHHDDMAILAVRVDNVPD
jgi:serine phosphatase RsbU (regulator of sigma subunit)/PAS domain-containing protein